MVYTRSIDKEIVVRKFSPRYYKPEEINFVGHWSIGTKWEAAGSKGDVYTIELTDKGFSCDGWSMKRHAKCKHTYNIAEKWIN